MEFSQKMEEYYTSFVILKHNQARIGQEGGLHTGVV